MINILEFLSLLLPTDFEYVKELSKIAKGIYSISVGGVTQKNISRQTSEEAYSYRSVQRFFALDINWELLYLSCISFFFTCSSSSIYILAIDEVVEKKSGKSTTGIGRFFSSIAGRPIRSVCFHVLSLIEVKSRTSFIVTQEQQKSEISNSCKKKSKKSKKKSTATSQNGCPSQKRPKKRAGRPKGSKNKTGQKEYSRLSKSFEQLLTLAMTLLASIGIVAAYIVADGAYGSKTYVLICMEQNICLISKLRNTSALYLPYSGKYKPRGRKRKYGEKIDYTTLNTKSEYYHSTIKDDDNSDIFIDIYHFPKIWVKFLPVQINVVVLIATNTRTGKVGRRILFTTDLTLCADLIIEYYSLRFQIEFNFRDAKQYFGLADFRAYKPTQVKNSVGLAFFMVNLTHIIRKEVMDDWKLDFISILDLKSCFRAEKHINRVLYALEKDFEQFKNKIDIRQMAALEAINLKPK